MFKSYGACLNGIGKQVFNILKRTTAKALRNHCVVNPQGKHRSSVGVPSAGAVWCFHWWSLTDILFLLTVTLEYFSCFQDTRLTRKYRKCIFKFGETLNYAADTASEDEIFSTLCCGFRSLSGCIDDAFLNNNGACTNPNINLRAYSKTLFKGLFGSVSDAFCSSYTEGTFLDFKFWILKLPRSCFEVINLILILWSLMLWPFRPTDICRSKMAKMELYAQDNNRLGLSNFSVIKDLVRLSEKLSS